MRYATSARFNDAKRLLWLGHDGSEPEAAGHNNNVLRTYLDFSRDTGLHLKQALAADEGLFLGYCVKGYFFKLFAIPALEKKALECVESMREFAKVVTRGNASIWPPSKPGAPAIWSKPRRAGRVFW